MRPDPTAGSAQLAALYEALAVQARQPARSAMREARARRVRGIAACVLFLLLIGASWLIGTTTFTVAPRDKTTAGPDGTPGQTAKADRLDASDGPNAGWIIRELPDGLSCSFAPLDNAAEWIGQPFTGLCNPERKAEPGRRDFSWGR